MGSRVLCFCSQVRPCGTAADFVLDICKVHNPEEFLSTGDCMSDIDSYIMRVYIEVYSTCILLCILQYTKKRIYFVNLRHWVSCKLKLVVQNGAPKDLMLDSLVSYFDMEMGMSYIPNFPGEEKHQSWIDLIYFFQVCATRCIVGTPQFMIHKITRTFQGGPTRSVEKTQD